MRREKQVRKTKTKNKNKKTSRGTIISRNEVIQWILNEIHYDLCDNDEEVLRELALMELMGFNGSSLNGVPFRRSLIYSLIAPPSADLAVADLHAIADLPRCSHS